MEMRVTAGHFPSMQRSRRKGAPGGWGWLPRCSCGWNWEPWYKAKHNMIFSRDYTTEAWAQDAWIEHLEAGDTGPEITFRVAHLQIIGQTTHRPFRLLLGP